MSAKDGFRFGEDRRDDLGLPNRTRTVDGGNIRHFPRFQLEYSADDRRRPSEITIYEHGRDIAVRWITADVEATVPLEDVA